MAYSQIEQQFRVKTPLGDDVLLLDSFTGEEGISKPFRFVFRLLCENPSLDMKGLLTKPLVLTMRLPDDTERHIHGIINRMVQLEYGGEGLVAYEAEVVPWLWFLSLFSDCRIFQKKSVQEIVEQVFQDRGFTDYKFQLQGSYPKREYCVQYRETDLNFVSRLLEEEGIFYFFEQTKPKHTLILTDSKSNIDPCPHQPSARYEPITGEVQDEDTILTFQSEQKVYPGTASLNDYDFEKPYVSLRATISDEPKGEFYDYPGNYKTKDEGDRYARIRLEEQEVKLLTASGIGYCRGFECGYRFTLTDHYRDDANQAYTIVSIAHEGRNSSYRSGSVEPFEYKNRFTAIPHATPFRPPQLAEKPVVEGSQTALVVGKDKEEIWVDKYGRIKVQFHWDREGVLNENSSCWVRVSQGWAGKQWGAIYLPRIGQEVIVDFLEGDPDYPIVTGRVYNADQMPPYTLSDEQTKSTLKSMSSKGGGGFNEIRLEDKKGSEQIFIHGEKDLDIRIKNDRKEWIGEDRHLIVKRDKLEKIGGSDNTSVGGDQIGEVGGSRSLTVQRDVVEEFKSNQSTDVSQAVYIKAGTTVVIEAGIGITLSVGGNFVTINPAGVQIQGVLVLINSGGSAIPGIPGVIQSPAEAKEADNADPGATTSVPSIQKVEPSKMPLGTITPASPPGGE